MKVCTRCGEPKRITDFRVIADERRHTWCRHCEAAAGKERAARYRSGPVRFAHDCAVVAGNLDHVLHHHGDAFDDTDREVLAAAADALRTAVLSQAAAV